MTPSIRYGLLGCGRVSARYLEVFASVLEGAELVACCDIDRAKADDAAAAAGAVAYYDMDEMISEERPDVVCILTESGRHYEHAQRVLDAGCHVVLEKPVALIPEHAVSLAAKARGAGLMLTVIKQNRWNPATMKLKQTVDSGRFGRIVTATVRLRWCRYQDYYEDGWHGTWAMDGGVVNQQAIHHIDALNWLCGPVHSLCASWTRRLMALQAEDTMVAILRFSSGALGTIEATTAARPHDVEASVSIIGENGMAVVGGVALNEIQTWDFVDPIAGDEDVPSQFSQTVPTGYGLGHGPYLQQVTDVIAKGDTAPVLSAKEAMKALEIVHALYASGEQGGWVNMADQPRSSLLGRGA